MPQRIDVSLRMCGEGAAALSLGGRPPWFSKRAAFANLLATAGADPDMSVTVLFDGAAVPQWLSALEEAADGVRVEVRLMSAGNGDRSFRMQYEHALAGAGDTIVYILEDDYAHVRGWPAALREAFGPALQPQKGVRYATLYDHLDKYQGSNADLPAKLMVGPLLHWRSAASTTNTFAARRSTLLADKALQLQFANSDHAKFLALGCGVWSCVPGYATHCHGGQMTPCVDWAAVITG